MSRLAVLTALVIALPAPAQDKADTHEGVIKDYLKSIEDLNIVLKEVVDAASQKSRHADLEKALKASQAVKGRMDKIGPPPAELNDKLKAEYKPKFEKALGTFAAEVKRVTQAPYGGPVAELVEKYEPGAKGKK